ncbi:proline-rich protein 23A3-like [Mastomys coucha]|uniref:proline-rich protein 23A3-like n=1 Tax=Mastomys coucha TaxID=35658 RepID=UPI001262A5C8|nr:proline-rich protein 23A3-like [Mastomys coucha]
MARFPLPRPPEPGIYGRDKDDFRSSDPPFVRNIHCAKRRAAEHETAAAPPAPSHTCPRCTPHPRLSSPAAPSIMLRPRPHSPSADPAPSPAKRRRLHQEPARPEPLAQPELEAPAGPATSALTSVVFLAAGCALQLCLDGVDLLLEPEPTSVLQVSLQGHTILLVPEGLQASTYFGQPGFVATSPQGVAPQDVPQETCEYFYQEDVCDEGADLDFLASWARPPDGQAAGSLSSITGVPSPWSQEPVPESSTGAERYSLRFIWELDNYLLGPSPGSTLQPLPPSPPWSPQEQLPPHTPCFSRSPRTPCKARKRLVYE